MNYWYMQVHPGDDPGDFRPEVMREVLRRFHDVGMGSARQWRGVPGSGPTRKRFKSIPNGDIAIIAHGREMFALVQFVGSYEPCRPQGSRWYEVHRKVRILCDDLLPYELAYIKAFHKEPAEGLPIRVTLAAIRKNEFVGWLAKQLKADKSFVTKDAIESGKSPVLEDVAATKVWKRDGRVVKKVLSRQQCEICAVRNTFEKNDGSQYFEAHHLIPMASQGSFNCSLDVTANVVCLCPQCHRMVHHGANLIVRKELDGIFAKRKCALTSVGIKMTKETFIKYALNNR